MIRLIPDVGAPLAVAAVNIATRTAFPVQHDWFVYGMTVLGYVGGVLNYGGEFVKQVGVASLPLTADKIYDRVQGMTVPKLAMRKSVRQPVTRSYQPEFEPVSPHAF